MKKLAYKCFTGLVWLMAACLCHTAAAQVSGPPSPPGDTSRIIHLLNADELMGIQPTGKDSSQLQKLTGNVRLMQGQTVFSCDSALQNLTLNTIDAFGHIHINQADTINTYSDLLHYEGNTKIATLTGNVRMTDGNMVLTTNHLDYDMNTHVGSYLNGGKLVTGSTVLVSQRGYYYADTKDTYFKNSVGLTDPEYTLATDTLLYNTDSRIATFVAPTTINTGGTIIHTACGYYNTLENFAHLCNRSTVIDSAQWLTADSLNFNRNTGIGVALGNVVWTDTANHTTMLAGYAITDQNAHTVLATQKPLVVLERDADTLFVAADTLFSGPLVSAVPLKDTAAGLTPAGSRDTAILAPLIPSRDSLKVIDTAAAPPAAAPDTTAFPPGQQELLKKDSQALSTTAAPSTDTLHPEPAPPPGDTTAYPGKEDSLHTAGLPGAPERPLPATDTAKEAAPLAAAGDTAQPRKTAEAPLPLSRPQPAARDTAGHGDTTSLRYIIAFHHVRLYSDSLQGVSDSLYYSDQDSSFHFYVNPVLWTGESQLTGDTIVLTTRDQHAERILLQQHAMIINQSGPGLYNQIKGTNITGYFSPQNQLEWMEVDGNAESMYYAQDDQGAYVGANKSTSAKIRMYFLDGHLNKVVLLKDVDGQFLPPTKVPEEDRQLRGFKWQGDRRPQSKADLMQ
jgi:lipopolysaccharide export system protein LptA